MSDQYIKLVGIDTDNVGTPRAESNLYTVPFKLSKTPDHRWAVLFAKNWDKPSSMTTMHRPRRARVDGASIRLNNTTIEEVNQYHMKTLRLVIHKTNTEWAAERAAEREAAEIQQAKREAAQEAHQRNVREIGDLINQNMEKDKPTDPL